MKFQNYLKFEDIKKENLPFLMKQYYEIKEQYKDFIVLFRVGEFFETYFDDAINFSNICNLTITRRKFKEVDALMAGIPYKKVNLYIEKLIKNNFKVVIVNQTDKKDENGNIIRKVSKIYTKGTIFEHEFLNHNENNYLASIYKINGSYHFSYSDISTGEIYSTSGNYEEINYELSRINPAELLIPKNNNIEKELYEAYRFELLEEKFYDKTDKNLALSGLIHYAESILMDYYPKFETIKEYEIKNFLLMDYQTRKDLELIENLFNNQKQGSILSSLDICKTPMGKRLLKYYLKSPVYDIEKIIKRQNIIKTFLENKNYFNDLDVLLNNIGDISRLSTKISNKTISPLEFLTIKEGLRVLAEIETIQKKLNLNIKSSVHLDDYFKILNDTFEDDIEKIKNGDFIKYGNNSELDTLKSELKEYENEIKEYENTLQQLTEILSLKINKKSGSYFIEIPNSTTKPISNDFMPVQKLKTTSKYTTEKLLDLDNKINLTINKINELRTNIFENLKKYSTTIVDEIRNYSKTIALLDVFYSMTKISVNYNFCCPKINKKDFSIENGFHIGAKNLWENFTPLNIDFENKNFILLTGTNGIGKSTLLKTVGTIIVLSQIGCFVPAKNANLPLIDKLYTVLTVSDEIIGKKSTHQKQMNKISKIIKNATKNSFILLDEIGKNTSTIEGASLNYSISKYLVENIEAKTISSTHFLNLKNLYQKLDNKIQFLKLNEKREIEKGFLDFSKGIEIAKLENLPDEIINEAKLTLNLIQFN